MSSWASRNQLLKSKACATRDLFLYFSRSSVDFLCRHFDGIYPAASFDTFLRFASKNSG